MKKHNGIIGLWKFIFCLVVVVLHVGESFRKDHNVLFINGAIAVEFFFLVSGYLMAKSISKTKKGKELIGKETFEFIWKKIKSFFPYVAISYIVALIFCTFLNQLTIKSYVLSIWDLLLLRFFGLKSTGLIQHLWYITAMLFSMSLLYPQIKKFKDNYFYFIAPLTVLILAGLINKNMNDLKMPHVWVGYAYRGMIRSYLDVCLGTLIFPLVEKLKKINFTKVGKVLLTLIEIGGFLIVLGISNFRTTVYDFVLLLILFIAVLISFSKKTLDSNILNNGFVYFLEKISLPIYCIHLPIRNFVRDFSKIYNFNLNYKIQVVIVLLSSIILGIIIMKIVEYFKNKKILNKVKGLIIKYD